MSSSSGRWLLTGRTNRSLYSLSQPIVKPEQLLDLLFANRIRSDRIAPKALSQWEIGKILNLNF
ncbi:hypothetical protein [Chamaesiphon sp. OTE_75_metabat_556]|uniref:hypothetical protein n=1 Tax=Chamaesiphon sp. OTE_75_metabat_556 TaxID=2964692 RepID=UPI00286C8D04|nr:hypothetical protein [Chamaesiphon sp. OTE_75_metabat_556]